MNESNICGQTLLDLVSRGNSIIAELLRLADFIPPTFRLLTKNYQAKYSAIIFDYDYFSKSEYYDNIIDKNPLLQDIDEEFRENNIEILRRFYKAFESVLLYITDLISFLESLENGVFIQQTMDSLMGHPEGKQLLAESLYLYGIMLLVIDLRIDGVIRDRMLVSYYRYTVAEKGGENITRVTTFLRSTGFSATRGAKRPPNYPEEYFARIQLDDKACRGEQLELFNTFVAMLLSRLRSDDLYKRIPKYGEHRSENRSAALATQAAMLYVILYFAPTTLHTEQAKMREIVDKHFPDNWVISIYMGITVDLCEAWDPYKAAKNALNNTVQQDNVQELASTHIAKAIKVDEQILKYLKQGILTPMYVLDNSPKLVNVLRDANVTIRWLMLHTHADPRLDSHETCKRNRAIILQSNYDPKVLFNLLLNTAQLEFLLKDMFRNLLAEKEDDWNKLKTEGSGRMSELSEVFSGATPLARVEKNENFQAYFAETGKKIAQLDYTNSTSAGRKITQIKSALEELKELHQIESSLQIMQFLKETQLSLDKMLRTINIQEETLTTFEIVGDLSFAWEIIDNYTSFMQVGIKADPSLIVKLRSTFLKLASALELPLERIALAKGTGLKSGDDFANVSQHYSSELVTYVRKVLQIIPESMFQVLHQIITMQRDLVKEVPVRLNKEDLKEYAQLDERAEISRMTHAISVFTEGILMMKSTLMGVVKVDPKQLLEDGIRKELVRQVANELDKILYFNPKSKVSELLPRVQHLTTVMGGFRRSFEYIQDYATIYGLKIWQEEVSRIVSFNVEQECNSFLRTKIYDFQSVYQSKTVPIPQFPQVDESVNFIGRLAREILRHSDPRTTVYIHQMGIWYDIKTQKELLNANFFTQLQDGVGTFGLTGIDRFFSFMIVTELQNFQRLYLKVFRDDKTMATLHNELMKGLEPVTSIPAVPKIYALGVQKATKLWTQYSDIILQIGQIQLIRRHIGEELNYSCKFDSMFLANSLSALNKSLLTDVEAHYADPLKPYPGSDSPLMAEVSTYLDCAGISNPLSKIYVTTTKLQHFPLNIFFFVLSQLQRLAYNKALGCMVAKKLGDTIDGAAFVVGVITLLKQFHSSHTYRFLAYLGQYVRTLIESHGLSEGKATTYPTEIVTALNFVEEFCRYNEMSRKTAEEYIPGYLFDNNQSHATQTA